MRTRRLVVAVVVLAAAALLGAGGGLALGRFGAGTAADAATRARLDDRAARIARQLQVTDPPMAVPIRFVSRQDWAATEVSCLRSAGYDADAAPGGGVSFAATGSRDLAAFERVLYTCEVRYPLLDGVDG